MTAKDFPDQKFEYVGPERVAVNFWHVTRNVMAREKVLYEGHAVAAVAATDAATAEEALSLIEVDYEVLPHVIDVDEAMKPDAPLLFEDMITRGVEPAPTKPSNISKRLEFKIGDLDAGFAQADVVIEKEFKTAAVHQGYIEPHACCVRVDADGQTEVWSSSQGHFVVRALTAKLLNMPVGDVRVRSGRDRRRLRRQDRDLSRAGRRAAVAEDRPAGQDHDDPRRGVQGHRPDLGLVDVGQDGRHEGRQDHRRRRRLQVPGRRLPGLAGDERVPVRVCPLCDRERPLGRLRRRVQPAEIGRLSRARLADLGLRGRERHRHAGEEDRHGSARIAPQERRARRARR